MRNAMCVGTQTAKVPIQVNEPIVYFLYCGIGERLNFTNITCARRLETALLRLTIKFLHHFNSVPNVEIVYCKWQFLVDATKIHSWCKNKHVGDKFVEECHFNFATILCAYNSLDAEETV